MSRRPGRESGAVAIMTAILAAVLLTVAALAVDLGNAWARKQDAQSQADLATLSAAQLLPRTPANQADIVAQVVTYLNSSSNAVPGQSPVTTTGLQDGHTSNGEVYFESDTRLRVVTPDATVNFGLAGAAGLSSTEVRADATAELQSQLPPMDEVIPFALPAGCPYGPGMADTASGPASDDGATFTPTGGQTGSHTLSSVSTNPSPVVQGSTTASVSLTLGELPSHSTGGTLRLYLGSTTYEDYPLTWASTTNTDKVRTVTKTLDDTRVTGTIGTWKAWVLTGSSNKYSTSSGSVVVGAATPAPSVGCSTSVSGNFGQLDSPGWGVSGKNQRFGHNIARGLDHLPVPFPTATADVCADNSGHNPIADAQLDDASRDGNNCLNIDTGNDGKWIMDGFVSGIDGHKGRIDADNGHTRSGCGSGDINLNGTTVNNDRISCFLRNGATLAQITNPDPLAVSENMIDPAITESPRFVWIPVLRSETRINDKWQPIKMYVPGLITGETLDGSTNPADPDNDGIVWSGNKITSLQIFTFNHNILPADERSPSGTYDPTLQSIVRLVD